MRAWGPQQTLILKKDDIVESRIISYDYYSTGPRTSIGFVDHVFISKKNCDTAIIYWMTGPLANTREFKAVYVFSYTVNVCE